MAGDGIVIVQDCVIKLYNPSASAMLGCEVGEVVGTEFVLMLPSEDRALATR